MSDFVYEKILLVPCMCWDIISCILNGLMLSCTSVVAEETEIVQPFLLGCDTKSLRVVQISLTALQRLITNEALSEVGTLFIRETKNRLFTANGKCEIHIYVFWK